MFPKWQPKYPLEPKSDHISSFLKPLPTKPSISFIISPRVIRMAYQSLNAPAPVSSLYHLHHTCPCSFFSSHTTSLLSVGYSRDTKAQDLCTSCSVCLEFSFQISTWLAPSILQIFLQWTFILRSLLATFPKITDNSHSLRLTPNNQSWFQFSP